MYLFREHYSDSSVGKVLMNPSSSHAPFKSQARGGHLYSTGEAEADDPWASQSNWSERLRLKNMLFGDIE